MQVTSDLLLDTTAAGVSTSIIVSVSQMLKLTVELLLQSAQVRLWLLMYFKSEISDVNLR